MTTAKEIDINKLSTLQITWHVVYRHRVVLLITSNIATLLVWFMQQAPTILQ